MSNETQTTQTTEDDLIDDDEEIDLDKVTDPLERELLGNYLKRKAAKKVEVTS